MPEYQHISWFLLILWYGIKLVANSGFLLLHGFLGKDWLGSYLHALTKAVTVAI